MLCSADSVTNAVNETRATLLRIAKFTSVALEAIFGHNSPSDCARQDSIRCAF